MRLGTRKLLDRCFSGLGVFSIGMLALALVVILVPIAVRGVGAVVFRETVEHRRMLVEKFSDGDPAAVGAETEAALKARQPLYDMLARFEEELASREFGQPRPLTERLKYKREMATEFDLLKKDLHVLLGPVPGEPRPVLPRDQYGQTRWDRAQVKLKYVTHVEEWQPDPDNPGGMLKRAFVPRIERFRGTSLEPFFAYVEQHLEAMLRPQLTFYWGFFTHDSKDAHFFGGIWAEMLGTFYLTIGAMLFAVPMGVIAAVYLVEYAGDNRLVSLLRSCISTLAGVPSIVFGLFGLAFFVNTLHVSGWFRETPGAPTGSVLAGALTLALVVLPIIIRASEEAIRSVPQTYREAALSLGASKWRTILTVILPAALPGMLTGIVISMGRAAGETAPVLFVAVVSVGRPLRLIETLTQETPALSWNIFNLCMEHEAVDELRHVQYGMTLTLVALVLLLNAAALILRARISRKLKG